MRNKSSGSYIFLAPKRRKECLLHLGLQLIFDCFVIVLWQTGALYDPIKKPRQPMFSAFLFFILFVMHTAILLVIWVERRKLGLIHVEKTTVVSYSFLLRKLCMIDLTHSVYYAIILANGEDRLPKEFLVISNRRFSLSKTNTDSFMRSYDRTSIIVLPFDERSRFIRESAQSQSQSWDGSMIDGGAE